LASSKVPSAHCARQCGRSGHFRRSIGHARDSDNDIQRLSATSHRPLARCSHGRHRAWLLLVTCPPYGQQVGGTSGSARVQTPERNRFRSNHDFALSVCSSHGLIRKVRNFSGSCSRSGCQRCPVDLFAVPVSHPNEAPVNLMHASVAA
jgi:hypothetical protein